MGNINSRRNNRSRDNNNLANQYQNKVNGMINRLVYIKDNSANVYQSDKLQQRFNAVTSNESASIQKYIEDNQESVRSKLNNLGRILNEENQLAKYDIEFIKSALDKYNEDFNSNIIKINYLDKEIMTKDKLILINEEDVRNKDNTIMILQSVLLYLFFMIIPFILLALGMFNLIFCIVLVIVLGIFTSVIVTIKYFKNKDVNIVKFTKKTAKDFVIDEIIPTSLVTKCPAKCKTKTPEPSADNVNPEYQQMKGYGNETWLDNSENRWKSGDIPSIGATASGYAALGNAEPKPYYEANPKSTKYVCKWMGDPDKMTNMNRGLEFATTIPCKFFPGYETVRKF